MYGICTVCSAGNPPYIRSYVVCIHALLANPLYARYDEQGINDHAYRHIRAMCNFTLLANPLYAHCDEQGINDYVQDHKILTSRVNRNINYIFGILTSRTIDWYINESILRGSGEGGGPGGVWEFGGGAP